MHAHHEQEHPVAPSARSQRRTSTAVPANGTMSPDEVLALQSTIGNAAVAPLLAGEEPTQSTSDSPVHQVLRGSGRPLDQDVQADMEARLGADFSDVRVHTDATADLAADSVRAEAFTSGSHVVFRRGGYDTSSTAGRRTLAHELTHVVQQRSGPVDGTPTGDGLSVSDPRDRFEREAEATAVRAMSGHHEPTAPTAPVVSDRAAPVPVARLMSTKDFKASTAVPDRLRILSDIFRIDNALRAFHWAKSTQYQKRAAALNTIITRGEAYEQSSQNDTRKEGVRKLLAQARLEVGPYEAMARGAAETDKVKRFRFWVQALDAIVAHDRDQPELAFELQSTLNIPSKLLELVTSIVDSTPARFHELALDSVTVLQGLTTKKGVPRETREMLNEVLSHTGKISFQAAAGPHGTRLTKPSSANAPSDKYTFLATMGQGSSAERAGYFAHEMTHVAAHESYDNTPMMLLFPPDIQDDELRDLIRERGDTIDQLRTDFEATEDAFTHNQRILVNSNLKYGSSQGAAEKYVTNFEKSGDIDDKTANKVKGWISIAGDRSGLMVEYDTVINQLLVYMAMWEIDAGNAFYVRLRQAARIANARRRAAVAARATPAAASAQASSSSQAPPAPAP